MSMLLATVVLVLIALVVGLVAFIATRPPTFRVQRSVRIKAAPETIYGLIADFQCWKSWSPFEDMDPDLKRDYSGAESGVGAVYGWSGNNRAGSGRMEITQAASPRLVIIKLDFLKPFEAHNIAEFNLESFGSETEVTWAMHGPNTPMSKAMSLFMSMDKMVGGMFATGLARMKAVAEG